MVMIYEYRIPLPFTMEEYEIAQLYMVAKFSASESTGDSGDGVEVLKNEPFEDQDRKGQYTHKVYHLASKLPSWLVSLLPKKALMLEEEAWNAYPRCTTILKCPFLGKFKLVVETNHVADRATTENALNLDAKTLKKRQVEFIDIAMDQVENYVEEEDPSLFRSRKTGRGPLKEGWQKTCEPVMCAYKCVTVDVPYWGFGSRIEKFIAKNAQRKILLEGHRKCFCWLDEWFGLTMADVRRMEAETAEAMRRARAEALKRLQLETGEAGDGEMGGVEGEDGDPAAGGAADGNSGAGGEEAVQSPVSRLTSINTTKSLRRKPSMSLVGPSFSVGITTLSATDKEFLDSPKSGRMSSSAPPMPSHNQLENSVTSKHTSSTYSSESTKFEKPKSQLIRAGSSESFNGTHFGQNHSLSWEMQQYNSAAVDADDEASNEVSKCVDVLDRAIGWAKALSLKKGAKGTGTVTPINEVENSKPLPDSKVGASARPSVDILDSTLSSVKRRRISNQTLSPAPWLEPVTGDLEGSQRQLHLSLVIISLGREELRAQRKKFDAQPTIKKLPPL
ncbi:hypothetical protein R1sor_026838 [Riccia sorocarpa]|uniref:Phosphatidylinositol transfer protein N-terminal domain-containing protein n=1 Tax=Riccia sorocarpa TaxID=122646 RepID=A0ABD3GCK7_9MARC